MTFHICSVAYKTNLGDEVVSERVRGMLDIFTTDHVYEFTQNKNGSGYTIETLAGEQVGFVTLFSQMIQFYMYVLGGPETLADAHALEAEMIELMATAFVGHERASVSLLAPLPEIQ